MRDAGFTLVEMLVVLAILALVMAIVPSLLIGSQGSAELAAGQHEIAAALRETRSLAIQDGHSEALIFDGAGAYRAGATGRPRRLPKGLHVALRPAMGARTDGSRPSVRFFPDGSSTGGRLMLSQGKRQADVSVDWISGRITLDATP